MSAQAELSLISMLLEVKLCHYDNNYVVIKLCGEFRAPFGKRVFPSLESVWTHISTAHLFLWTMYVYSAHMQSFYKIMLHAYTAERSNRIASQTLSPLQFLS